MDYGFEPWFVVGANLDVSSDNLVVGKPDAFALPFDLAPHLTGAQVTSVHDKLEAINLPGDWVNTSLTWLQVVRIVFGVISYMQRFAAVFAGAGGGTVPAIFTGGRTLNSTFGSLPALVQTAMISAAQSLGIPTTGLTGSTTLRAILRNMATFFESHQYNFNGTMV
jgi:hypothetical protein